MALGVLNNLSAIYAENNLNNTNSSLQTVLQQLSSGSRINSGADDAAGLSLVNGLAANSKALVQSATNATEGVGLLQVADGALSQVTNLLNRAITLATEASNGTLNSSQSSAANQEYQSILAEVNNIGSTTTYNQKAVFSGNTVSIYTGDASPTGSSIDNLYIRTLSSSGVGDRNGIMSYNNGQNNVFIDLSKGGINAAATDTLNIGGSTSLTVNYLTKGAGGSVTSATANITVGSGTNYANTAQGMIDAINNSGLGLTATFTTAAQAGAGATAAALDGNNVNSTLLTTGLDTGIEISGLGVGVNTNTGGIYSNGAGEVGTLTVSNVNDQLGGTLSIVGTDGASHTITLGKTNSTDTLANLAATINAAGYGVTATVNPGVVANPSGTHRAGTVLTLTSASASVSVAATNITDTQATPTAVVTTSFQASTATSTVAAGPTPTSTIGVINVNAATDTLSGVLKVTQDAAVATRNNNLLLGQGSTDTLADLAATINANVGGIFNGIAAALSNNNTTLTMFATSAVSTQPVLAVATGSQILDSVATTGTAMLTQSALQTIAAATVAGGTSTAGVGVPANNFARLTVASAGDYLAGAIAITPDGGAITQFNLGGYTINTLAAFINANNAGGTFKNMTAMVVGNTIQFNQTTKTAADVIIANGTVPATDSAVSTIGTLTTTNANDALTAGTITIQGGATATAADTKPFTLGTAGSTDNLTNLANTINSWSTANKEGVVATVNSAGTAINFTTNGVVTQPLISGSGFSTSLSLTGTPVANQSNATVMGTLQLPAGGASGDVLSGSITVGGETIPLGVAGRTNTMANLAATINSSNLGFKATLDLSGTAMVLTTSDSQNASMNPNVTLAMDSGNSLQWKTANQGQTNSQYYSIGISGTITDSSSGGGTGTLGMSFNTNGSGGAASMGYSDTAGQSLSNTDLADQINSQAALGYLNAAIADVAAMDGYIGAQINILNAISQVMATQQENIVSAQNAIQATDYASATSNMSKYEILSQTGIAALAQANQVQQEVTKLLQ